MKYHAMLLYAAMLLLIMVAQEVVGKIPPGPGPGRDEEQFYVRLSDAVQRFADKIEKW